MEACTVTEMAPKNRIVLVTGGAGFIGSNLVERFLDSPGTQIRIFDNLSRPGVSQNIRWLSSMDEAGQLEVISGDVRDAAALEIAARDVSEIYHLAAQVAVTTSVDRPRADFEVNALGTFNVLEAARKSGNHPFLFFTSTNKVYGGLHSIPVVLEGTHYRATDRNFRGVDEQEKLDFHSPYGCSKGAADQYVRDYARIFNLPTVVFRMSCIAGPRQFGNEDQGWVAHFLYSLLEGRPISIYGDGYQVRDVLHVSDLIDAIQAAQLNRDRTSGEIYNLGGGVQRAISIREMLTVMEASTQRQSVLRYSAVRPGDQPLYVSNTDKLTRDTGWIPTTSLEGIIIAIKEFWHSNRDLLQRHRLPGVPELVAEEVA